MSRALSKNVVREVRAALVMGFLVGWLAWWISRCHSETAHLVDLWTDGFLHGVSNRVSPSAVGRIGGAVRLSLLSGLLGSACGLVLAPWVSFFSRAKEPAAVISRQVGLQLGITVLAWSGAEWISLAFEPDAFGFAPWALFAFLGGVLGTGATVMLRRWSTWQGVAPVLLARGWVLPLLALGFLAVGLSRPPVGSAEHGDLPRSANRVLVIGVDGAGWDVVGPFVDQGVMPALKGLVDGGVRGRLRSVIPPFSPPVWTSIATGVRPSRHGVEGFTVPVAGDWRSVPIGGAQRRVPAIWDLANAHGMQVVLSGWYATWPAEPLHGWVVSDRALLDGLTSVTWPDSIAIGVGQTAAQVSADRAWLDAIVGANAFPVIEEDLVKDRVMVETTLRGLGAIDWELALLYMRATDSAQHLTWKDYTSIDRPRTARWAYGIDEISQHADVIERTYRWTDGVIADVLDAVGPETTVLVVSDHGAGYRLAGGNAFDLNPLLRHMGLQHGEGQPDLAQSLLYERMDERPFWSAKRRLHFSVRGRDKGGWIAPDRVAELRDSVATVLSQVRYPGGDAFFERIELLPMDLDDPVPADIEVRVGDSHAPVILLPGGKRVPTKEIISPSESGAFSGNHRMGGLLVASGPGIRQGGVVRGASALDVAPTVAALLGLPIGDHLEGRVLDEILDRPVRRVRSSDWGVRLTPGGALGTDAEAEEEIRRQLRGLGYIQ